jgi:hypothetical protein
MRYGRHELVHARKGQPEQKDTVGMSSYGKRKNSLRKATIALKELHIRVAPTVKV